MIRFASNPMDRHQATLFRPTLDETIGSDHPVRLFDEILGQCDWVDWENHYSHGAGRPPIHPRIMASIILYGLSRGVRSSRMLEYLSGNSMDYLWLTQGHQPDHSTLCDFRTSFKKQLKDLFRQIGQVALDLKLASLLLTGLDGSRIKANSSRNETAGEKKIEAELEELNKQIDAAFAQMAQNDSRDKDLFGQSSTVKLPRELANLKARQEKLNKSLEAVKKKQQKADKAKGKNAKPASVPVADPESTILPNKEGGFAPNYTVFATTESKNGFIMDAEVIIGGDESSQTLQTIDRIEENYGEKPQNIAADTAFGSGDNLAGLEERDVTGYMPQFNRPDQTDNPAPREDPTQAVPAEAWDKLPRDAQSKKLHRTAFVYDEKANCYYCPMGRKLDYTGKNTKPRKNGDVEYDAYRCKDCSGCELSEQCLNGKKLPRTVYCDQHEHLRKAMDERMASEAGQKIYRQRNHLAETPFAFIKNILGLRQFSLRGIEKVTIEWFWTCTGYNLAKLIRLIASLRAELALTAG